MAAAHPQRIVLNQARQAGNERLPTLLPLLPDAAVEALHPAVGLRRVGSGVPIRRTEFSTDFGEGRGEATAVISQHVGQAEREGGGCLAQEGNGALLGLVVLDGVDRARAAVDGDVEIALAPFAIGGLQLGRSSPRFQPRSGWNGCGGRCLMSMCTKPRS